MTTIYIPTPITSAAQVEALPVGTVLTHPNHLSVDIWGEEERCYGDPALGLHPVDFTDGWTALIPTVVDVHESEPLDLLHHRSEHIDRAPFTCYIDYKETPR